MTPFVIIVYDNLTFLAQYDLLHSGAMTCLV